MLQACMLGGRIGIVTLDEVYLPWHREEIRRYGLESRVVDIQAMALTPDEAVAAVDDPEGYARIKKTFEGIAAAMVERSDVDLVMSAGGLFALLSANDHVEVPGALVVNPTYLAVRQAEVAVAVARTAGTAVSRGGTFARATDQAVSELIELVGAGRRAR